MRVLVVDDDASVRALLAQALRASGWDVAEAPDIAQALRAAQDALPDLLVTDVALQGASGAQLAASLTAHRPGPAVLYVSGHPVAHVRAAVAEHGAPSLDAPTCRFLQKPFGLRELIETARALGRELGAG